MRAARSAGRRGGRREEAGGEKQRRQGTRASAIQVGTKSGKRTTHRVAFAQRGLQRAEQGAVTRERQSRVQQSKGRWRERGEQAREAKRSGCETRMKQSAGAKKRRRRKGSKGRVKHGRWGRSASSKKVKAGRSREERERGDAEETQQSATQVGRKREIWKTHRGRRESVVREKAQAECAAATAEPNGLERNG